MTKFKEKDEEETPSISLKRFNSKDDESADESLMNRGQTITNLNDISLPEHLNLITGLTSTYEASVIGIK